MKIGNILININANILRINLDHFNIFNKLEMIDNDLPTLIIGRSFLSEIFKDKTISFLDKKINDKLYWTFTPNENRSEMEIDINNFYKKIIDIIKNRINYIFFDIYKRNLYDIKKIINLIKNDNKLYIYINNDSFIYISYDNTIVGISITDIKYIGINYNKIINLIKSGNNIIIFDNFINFKIKRIINNDIYLIPYFYKS